jgi:hypothetical protein
MSKFHTVPLWDYEAENPTNWGAGTEEETYGPGGHAAWQAKTIQEFAAIGVTVHFDPIDGCMPSTPEDAAAWQAYQAAHPWQPKIDWGK